MKTGSLYSFLSLVLLTSSPLAAASAVTGAQPAAKPAPTAQNVSANQLKIGVVDPYKAMELSDSGKQEGIKLEKLRNDLTEAYKKKEQKLAETMKEYQLKQSTLTSEARSMQENRMIDMKRDLESTAQASDDQLKLATQRATEKLSKEIETAIAQVVQEGGYELILHSGTTLYVSPDLVITDKVIDVMNKNYAKAQAVEKKPAKPTADKKTA